MKDYKEKLQGVYLVLDPSVPEEILIEKLEYALKGGVSIVQIWDNWPKHFKKISKINLIQRLHKITGPYSVPLLINNEWELLENESLDGVHFDIIPHDFEKIKGNIKRKVICGITCNNDLTNIAWAERNKLDYISFCAMFPSSSVDTCEIVNPDTILKARKMTQIPLFLSGGITPDNFHSLKIFNFQGIAVISGILSAESPEESVKKYYQEFNKIVQ